jgi:hypothetical protein
MRKGKSGPAGQGAGNAKTEKAFDRRLAKLVEKQQRKGKAKS